MGQIADDCIDGSCCSLCLRYFEDKQKKMIFTHGYPVVCKECWDDLSKKHRKMYQLAIVSLYGRE
jgi:hypothetical protein